MFLLVAALKYFVTLSLKICQRFSAKAPLRDFCQFCENGFSKCIANQDIAIGELSQIILTSMPELVMGSGNHQHQLKKIKTSCNFSPKNTNDAFWKNMNNDLYRFRDSRCRFHRGWFHWLNFLL